MGRYLYPTQRHSIQVIAKVLGYDDATYQSGPPNAIRTNVCDRVLAHVCGGSPDSLSERMFEYCKVVAGF